MLCLELDSTNKQHKKIHPLPTRFPPKEWNATGPEEEGISVRCDLRDK